MCVLFRVPGRSPTLFVEDRDYMDHGSSPDVGLEFDRLGEWKGGSEEPGLEFTRKGGSRVAVYFISCHFMFSGLELMFTSLKVIFCLNSSVQLHKRSKF